MLTDLAHIQHHCLFYCCCCCCCDCRCVIRCSVYFFSSCLTFVLILHELLSLFFLRTLSPAAGVCALCAGAYCRQMRPHIKIERDNFHFGYLFISTLTPSRCVYVCASLFFYCRLFLTSLQTHSTDKYKFLSNSALNILPQQTAVHLVRLPCPCLRCCTKFRA